MAWVELGMRWNDEGGVRSRKKKGEAPHNKDDDDGKSKNSISNCRALKSAYHDCFNRWYTEKFVKGQWEKEECMVEWETYRACVLAWEEEMQKRMEERKLSHLLKTDPGH